MMDVTIRIASLNLLKIKKTPLRNTMKIQNIFNFGLILLISAALMLSGCAKEEDSSSSTA